MNTGCRCSVHTRGSNHTLSSINLASEIPTPVHAPEFYLKPTDKAFSLQIPTVDTVYRQPITLDEKKSAGLDNIPNKILKIAADVIAPSLTEIFAASIRAGVFPFEWKTSRVSSVASLTSKSRYANISVFIDCENNQFLKK